MLVPVLSFGQAQFDDPTPFTFASHRYCDTIDDNKKPIARAVRRVVFLAIDHRCFSFVRPAQRFKTGTEYSYSQSEIFSLQLQQRFVCAFVVAIRLGTNAYGIHELHMRRLSMSTAYESKCVHV